MTAILESVIVGVDIGGTKIAAALVGDRGELQSAVVTVPSQARDGAEAVLNAVARVVSGLVSKVSAPVRGIGIGSAGVISEGGVVRSSTDLIAGWSGTDIRVSLRGFGLPVVASNDVHAFALGEVWRGAGRAHRTVLAVAVGTGIGGAIIVDGRLHSGRTGTAGSVGHTTLWSDSSRACSCGQRGHLEAYASGPAMELNYLERTGRDLPLIEIGRLVGTGDVSARETVDAGARALGQSLGGLANVLDPDVIVLGGGVVALGEDYVSKVRQGAREGGLPGPATVPVVVGELGPSATIIGAAHLVADTEFKPDLAH